MDILMGDINVTVERKWIRSMRLAVYPPDGRVVLRMPMLMPESRAREFLTQKWSWICRARERVLSRPAKPERRYVSGETHYVFGSPCTLQLEYVTSGANSVRREGDTLVMRCRASASEANREALLYAWYREVLRAELDRLVAEWLVRLDEAPITWSMRRMRSMWGNCRARTRRVVFSVELARVPMACVEYVVVHELTHLVVQNHGPAFRALMTRRLPEWQSLRRQLRTSGY